MKCRSTAATVIVAIALAAGGVTAQDVATLDRPYDPLVIPGSKLAAFSGTGVDRLRVYRYDAASAEFQPIPYQIDERKAIVDPWDPPNIRLSYFVPDDGLLDADDELVVMCRDLGDRAPSDAWPDFPDLVRQKRVEVEAQDPLDGGRAWFYIFEATTGATRGPSPYGMDYDPDGDVIRSEAYAIRMGRDTGLIEDIAIEPPFGTGVDIFDTQKIRMVGLITVYSFTLPFGRDWNPYAANERDNLFIYQDSTRWIPSPVVRVVRQPVQAVKFGGFVFEDARFPVETQFFPYSGRVRGGADLTTLGELVIVDVELLRQSWDFNANAVGMRLYTRYNSDVPIDGEPDAVDRRVDLPIREWMMATGDQGTLFVFFALQDTIGTVQQLYYHDDRTGGQADGTQVEGGDTGYDGASYGDVGVLAKGHVQQPNLRLDFAAYVLPANQSRDMAERLAQWVQTPLTVVSREQAISSVLETDGAFLTRDFRVTPLSPNPFGQTTSFAVQLEHPAYADVTVLDILGRTVASLHRGWLPSGGNRFVWGGRDDSGRELPDGTYLVRVRVGNRTAIQRVTIVR